MADSYTKLFYHITFHTEGNRRPLTPAVCSELYPYIGGIVRRLSGKLVEAGGTRDHVHLLAILPASVALSDAVRDIKAVSSKWMNQRGAFAWQGGYGGFTVSQSGAREVQEYIWNQEKHHKEMTALEELKKLLRYHQIDFDEKYLA
jgi:REP element-mobilizing transposase RayT